MIHAMKKPHTQLQKKNQFQRLNFKIKFDKFIVYNSK